MTQEKVVKPTPFPEIIETTTSTSSIPFQEAEHRRQLHRWTSYVFLILVSVLSLATFYLLFTTSRSGAPEAQKIAFGFIGTILGVLWSNFAKLVDSVSKR